MEKLSMAQTNKDLPITQAFSVFVKEKIMREGEKKQAQAAPRN